MFDIFAKLGLPIPSKKDIIFVIIIVVLALICWKQHCVISDKNEIIDGKNTEISVQKKTISELDKSYKESSEKINQMNAKLNVVENTYQAKLNEILLTAGKCKSDLNPSEIEKKARVDFQKIIDDLAHSTKKER